MPTHLRAVQVHRAQWGLGPRAAHPNIYGKVQQNLGVMHTSCMMSWSMQHSPCQELKTWPERWHRAPIKLADKQDEPCRGWQQVAGASWLALAWKL
jgi:hypothetical protein